MLSKQNICKDLLTQRPKTSFSRQCELVNQHEPPLIELRGAHFLDKRNHNALRLWPRRSQKCKSTASNSIVALVLNGLMHHLLLRRLH